MLTENKVACRLLRLCVASISGMRSIESPTRNVHVPRTEWGEL